MEMIPNVVYRFIIISCIVFANFTDIVGVERVKGDRENVGGRKEKSGGRKERGGGRKEEGEGDGRKVPPVRPLISDVNFLLLRLNLCLGICVLWTHSFLTLYHILQLTS